MATVQVASVEELKVALQWINDSRGKISLLPVELDDLACELAKERAIFMAKTGTLSHYNENGEKPYKAYFDGGLRGHVEESIYGQDVQDVAGNGVDLGPLVEAAHQSFVDAAEDEENPEPEAVYMRNVLQKEHTHVGIAAVVYNGVFRFIEIFVDRYLTLDPSTPVEVMGPTLQLKGVMDLQGYAPFGVIVYRDPPLGKLTAEDLSSDTFLGPYQDFSDERVAMVWPWDIAFDTGAFECSVPLEKFGSGGNLYIQIYAKEGDNVSREKEVNLQMPGKDAIVAMGWQVSIPEKAEGGLLAELSVAGDDTAYSLEELAARRDATGMASKPDGAPIAELVPIVGVGMLVPAAGFESTHYMPVERQEQVSSQNFAVAFRRIEADSGAPVATDITIVESIGVAEVVAPEGYTLVKTDILPTPPEGTDASSVPHAFFALKLEPADACSAPPIVDLAVVYGPQQGAEEKSERRTEFEMSGGFETMELPESVSVAYNSRVYICTKREGAGHVFAEQMAAKAAADAAAQIDAETGMSNASLGSDNDLDDELLDTSLSPEQIRELEEKRAQEMRERAMKAEAEAEEQRRMQYSLDLKRELGAANEKREDLLAKNTELQRKLAALLATQKRRDASDGANEDNKSGGGTRSTTDVTNHEAEKQYSDTLNGILDTEDQFKYMTMEFDRVAFDLQKRLDEKEAKASDIADSFREFKTQIALQAEHSRTGKGIPKKVVELFKDQEKEKDEEASKVRLRNINLRMTLRKLENSLRAKEQLAEGLHLIDFEQLKIENQTLNEKIDERNEELHKLRKKKTQNVEVLTHIKEKLQFTSAENEVTAKQLSELDTEVSRCRALLTKAKREREALRSANVALKAKQGFANSDLLVMDYENRKQELSIIREKIHEVQDKYTNLAAFVKDTGLEF